MLKQNHIVASNKAAQNHGAQTRVAVDEAVVVARQYAGVAAEQTVLGVKCAASYVGAFIRSFAGK